MLVDLDRQMSCIPIKDPLDIAQQNEQEFIVEGILAHRGNHHHGVLGSMGWLRRELEQLETIQGSHACG